MKNILALVLCTAMLFCFAGCDSRDYEAALGLMDNQEWAAAREIFAGLEDYKDSAAMVTECDYNIALGSMQSADYDTAIARFEALGEYKDSAALAVECLYLKAVALYEDGQHEAALDIFSAMEDYNDAERYTLVCNLLLDQNGCIDDLVSEIEGLFADVELPFTLEENVYEFGQRDSRDFSVSYDGCSESTTVIFSHLNENGSSSSHGQINGITVLGDASSADEILIVYPEFAASAGIALSALDKGSDPEELILMVNDEFDKLIENGPTDGNSAVHEFEHNGYGCKAATLFLSDYYRFVFTVSIPELAE